MKANEFIREGADFMGYMKEKDPEGGIRWTYPDGFETHTPHRSNFAAREFLSKVGMDTDFENSGPMDINTFIGTLSQFGHNDKEIKMYHDEAVRIKKTHPEITHVAFI
jgi:hypothetical protein